MKTVHAKKTGLFLVALFLISACITVNINFPAAEIRKQAEEIVDDVYGIENPDNAPTSSLDCFIAWLLPKAAFAQDATTISNASIRALKGQLKAQHNMLAPFFTKGNVGIDKNGMLTLKDTKGMNMKNLAKLRRTVKADNNIRNKLYAEVAKAMNIPSGQVNQVKDIYADLWRQKAGAGWWIQDDKGAWKKK